MSSADRVSIVIPTWNRAELLSECLSQIKIAADVTSQPIPEIIVVDNGSTDETRTIIDGCSFVRGVHLDRNLGFAVACNRGEQACLRELVCFLNNDAFVQPGWLEPLVSALSKDPTIATAGPKLIFPDGRIQCAAIEVRRDDRGSVLGPGIGLRGKPGDHPDANQSQVAVVSGACLMIRRAVFSEVGGFDEGYLNGCEDIDLCLTLFAKGWQVVYEPASIVVHLESQSGPTRFAAVPRNRRLLRKKWKVAG